MRLRWLTDTIAFWRAGAGIRAAFAALAVSTFLVVGGTGLLCVVMAQHDARTSPSIQSWASSVSKSFFTDMLSLEVPHLGEQRKGSSTFAGKRVLVYMADQWLQVNLAQPQSLLAGELRGMKAEGGEPQPTAGAVASGSPKPSAAPSPQPTPTPAAQAGAQPESKPDPSTQPVNGLVPLSTQGRKAVLVYHSHPRESWVPELNAKTVGEAENADKNITLVGKHLAGQLEKAGIGTVHSAADYKSTVPEYNWNFSYKYSQQTVQEAMAVNDGMTFMFDLHRDSAAREVTTAQINGKDYAKVYFIVGRKNENWEQNDAFAQQIHDKLEQKYPGLSRGIWDKGTGGHGEYNQSYSPNSMLVEVGGAYNTLEESNRTADALAEVIAELFWESEQGGGTVVAKKEPAKRGG
ncbi:stage II sporulation protein P [Paenibacillus koleovorans]|uniref:stage II sporulation protein P n=1 Tax=Paenibacillus koleovorans TaxID=121608 RepID=UPI000FDA5C20|nr:stage II sporulation protein P [Paenibacillus koleovorans]